MSEGVIYKRNVVVAVLLADGWHEVSHTWLGEAVDHLLTPPLGQWAITDPHDVLGEVWFTDAGGDTISAPGAQIRAVKQRHLYYCGDGECGHLLNGDMSTWCRCGRTYRNSRSGPVLIDPADFS